MINFYNQVPSVYNSASRDFQYISWLVNIVLNSVKHNIDDLYKLPNISADPKIIELFATTLGFRLKRNYDQKQLIALVAVLPTVLKYKGTIKAINMAAEALVTASGSLGDASCSVENALLTVVLPRDIADTTLFTDLLEYILPAGMSCRIVSKTQVRRTLQNIEVKYFNNVRYKVYSDIDLASLFDVDAAKPVNFSTANFVKVKYDEGNESKYKYELNAGLLDNTFIPVLGTETVKLEETVVNNTIMLYSTEADGSHKQLLATGILDEEGNIAKVTLYAVDPEQEL